MTAPIAWLDHSELHRRQVTELLKQFEEKDTVDELGIGTIRDALSDRLFPGTSIIQTRARYFLIIPWMYLHLEGKAVPSARIAATARKAELDLIQPLLDSEDPLGTIGRIARNSLKTLASAIYWQGLRSWGISTFEGNRAEYHASIDGYYRRVRGVRSSGDEGDVFTTSRNWHASLPVAPNDFPEKASFRLTVVEAKYLAERIQQRHRLSLLAHLVTECSSRAERNPVWKHPDYASFPERNKLELQHARMFSEVMHGASILYNLIVAELRPHEEWTAQYREMFLSWQAEINERLPDLRSWNLAEFWRLITAVNPRLHPLAKTFVTSWISLVTEKRTGRADASPDARKLVMNRERAIKGRQARVDNQRARELWQGASGLRALDYRWQNIGRQLVTDIRVGLEQRDA